MMKQKQNLRKRVVSGFTLLEMIVVIAIIAILTGVLVPTMRNYITRSRMNTANSSAKVLFNSLQTVMMEYEFKERTMTESAFYGEDIYKDPGHMYLFIKCDHGRIQTSGANATQSFKADWSGLRTADAFKYKTGITSVDTLGAAGAAADPSTLGSRLARLFTDYDQVSWCALIDRYSVRGVVCATDYQSNYVGGYPLSMETRYDAPGNEIGVKIANCSVSDLNAYCTVAWASATPSSGT